MAENKSQKSALVIIPPAHLCNPIQEIRREHDKAFDRWMPHINLLYPFVEDVGDNFENYAHKISSITETNNIKKFKIIFDDSSFNFFKHKNNLNFHLSPSLKIPPPCTHQDHPIIELQSILETAFPAFDDLSNIKPTCTYTPHLTLGQCENEVVVESVRRKWRRVEWMVDAVHLISRNNFNTPFEIIRSVPLLDF